MKAKSESSTKLTPSTRRYKHGSASKKKGAKGRGISGTSTALNPPVVGIAPGGMRMVLEVIRKALETTLVEVHRDELTVKDVYTPEYLRELEGNLKQLFNTPVTVTEQNGEGSVTLRFKDRNHFQRLITLMHHFVRRSVGDRTD